MLTMLPAGAVQYSIGYARAIPCYTTGEINAMPPTTDEKYPRCSHPTGNVGATPGFLNTQHRRDLLASLQAYARRADPNTKAYTW